MESYWYVTKGKFKPKRRGLISVLIRKNYTVIELAVEVDKDTEEKYSLRYLGYGKFSDFKIQSSLLHFGH